MAARPPARIAIVVPLEPEPVVAAGGSRRFPPWPPLPEPVALTGGSWYWLWAGLPAIAVAGAAKANRTTAKVSQRRPSDQACPSVSRLTSVEA